MNYNNALKFIRKAPAATAQNLLPERFLYLCRLADNQHKKLNYIRLAGTNGKTICNAMLSSVLALTDINVISLNMTELDDPSDNITVNNEKLDMQTFTATVEEVFELCADMRRKVEEARAYILNRENDTDLPSSLLEDTASLVPTRGELLLLTMLVYCKKHHCKLCIIESSNTDADPSLLLPPPFAAVICGAIPSSDKKRIAKIKNYIQRGIVEVVSAPDDALSYKAISDTCAAINCRLSVPIRSALSIKHLSLLGTRFVYANEEYTLSLCGRFQTTNAITVIETLKLLRRNGYVISKEAEIKGLARVKIPSRFEVVSVTPTVIADSTYKSEAVETVCESLFDFSLGTGQNISLCLPNDIPLVAKYTEMLTARGYNIKQLFSMLKETDESEKLSSLLPEGCEIYSAQTAKALAKLIHSKSNNENVLLISGNNAFTSAVRIEILRKLQF